MPGGLCLAALAEPSYPLSWTRLNVLRLDPGWLGPRYTVQKAIHESPSSLTRCRLGEYIDACVHPSRATASNGRLSATARCSRPGEDVANLPWNCSSSSSLSTVRHCFPTCFAKSRGGFVQIRLRPSNPICRSRDASLGTSKRVDLHSRVLTLVLSPPSGKKIDRNNKHSSRGAISQA